jgi:hypothetical protein
MNCWVFFNNEEVGQYNKSKHSKLNHNILQSDSWKEKKYWNMFDEFEIKALYVGRVWRV